MRIISNNKTDDYSNYLERKKGVINFNNTLIGKPKLYNSKTNNITINAKHKIVRYKSYEFANNVKNIKPYFNNKCYPNNKDPKQILNLKEGRTSNFNMENIIINTEIFNNTSCNSNYIFGNNISNLTYNIKNNYVSDKCILNYILKNLSIPKCPTNININNNEFNIISLFGENLNIFVDRDDQLLFSNLKKYNIPIKFGFTLSGGSLPLSQVKQFNRTNLLKNFHPITNEEINISYITNKIFTNLWDSSNIAFSNQELNFTQQSNNIIFPEFNYEIYDYFMELEDNGCIRKKQIDGINTNISLIDLSFETPVPTREQVNLINYNTLLSEIDENILENDFSLNNFNLTDFSYHHLFWKTDRKPYNVIFVKNDINLELSDNLLSFVILKNYKIYLGKTQNLKESENGTDLDGSLCYFTLNIQNPSGILIYNENDISSSIITGYDENFDNQLNTTFNSDISLNMNISPSIDISIDLSNIEYRNKVRIEKIKGYYLGLDISNIELIDIPLKDLCLNDISNENLTNKFSIQIRQHFVDAGLDIPLFKNLDFIVNKFPENKILVNNNISFLSFNFINLNSLNHSFGINFVDLSNLYLELNYDISLDNLTSKWIFNNNFGEIDISINFKFNDINFSPNVKTILLNSNQLYDSSNINYDVSTIFSIGNLNDNINDNNNFSLDISHNIKFFDHPVYNFSNEIKILSNQFQETALQYLNNNLDSSKIISNFSDLFKINFREKDNIDDNDDNDDNDKNVKLELLNPGIYKITNDGSFVNWTDFSSNYDQINSLNEGQLLWDNYAFITKNSTILDSQIKYIDYSNFFGNKDKNYKSLENSGNLIISHIIDNYFDKESIFNLCPKIIKNYKFITLKINLKQGVLYLSNNILINCWKREINNIYNKLKLVDDFILFVCEENEFYDLNNSRYQGRSAWMNACKNYDTQSFNESVRDGGGCYNPFEPQFWNKDGMNYELFIPLLNTRSSTAIYLKIGLPVDSFNNIARVNYKLPEFID